MVRCDFCPMEAVVMDKDGFLYCDLCAEKETYHDCFIAEKKEFIHLIVKARRIFRRQIKKYPPPEQTLLKELFQEKVYEFEEIFDVTHYLPTVEEFLLV